MSVELLTKDDFLQFKTEFFNELRQCLEKTTRQKKWLKTDEVRKLLKISPGTLQNLRVNGTLQYSRIGSIIYYDAGHIEDMLQKNLQKSFKH